MDNRIDAEEIGALLDGRVDERRRDELLARLATAADDYDLFADTAAVLREAEGEVAENEAVDLREVVRETGGEAVRETSREVVRETEVIPLRPRRAGGWRSPARWTAMAAALAALALVPVLRSRMNADRWRDPARLYALSSASGARLPPDWDHAWGQKRGGGETAENSAVAARVGAMHMDMVVAANAGDTKKASELAATTAALLKTVYGGLGAGGEYAAITDSTQWSGARVLEQLAAVRPDAADITEPDYFAVGAWTEAARLATNRRDAAFFRTRESREALERAVSLEGLNDQGRLAATNLRDAVGHGEIQDWTSLANNLAELQDALAR